MFKTEILNKIFCKLNCIILHEEYNNDLCIMAGGQMKNLKITFGARGGFPLGSV
jgi:hypothetical protein